MKLLFDENLSLKLVSRLADLCPGSMDRQFGRDPELGVLILDKK